ncbi:acyltransferase family protein [Ramlibacter rhizophilus]|nr:acyltransferase family protein [Ramlibacter rhizophilus]
MQPNTAVDGRAHPRADAWAHYRSDIDGLRALAVVAVVLHHLMPSAVTGGFVGVDVFFVISGYLITTIIHREMAQGRFNFGRFYERRARRLFPALFAMLAATAVAGWLLLLPSDLTATLLALLGTLSFSANFVFYLGGSDYFDATDLALNPLLHTWSLAVEEQFYLLFPIVLLMLRRRAARTTRALLLAGAVGSLAIAAAYLETNRAAVFYLAPFRAWELLVGCLLALGSVAPVRSRAVRELLAAGGLGAIVASCVLLEPATLFPGLAALAPVLGAAAVIHAGSHGERPAVTRWLLQARPVVYVGLISYSLYLWHWPVLVFARYASAFEQPTWATPLLLAGSLALASLSYHFVEQPWRRPTPARPRRGRPLIVASASALALGAFAAWGLLVDRGFADRYDALVLQHDRTRSERVAWRPCATRPLESACVLGAPERSPDVLLWGDSHLLAWAPAMDKVLAAQGRSGVLAARTACPPMFEARSRSRTGCRRYAETLRAYLQAHPQIRTVVLAGFWGTYFRDDGPLTRVGPSHSASGLIAAEESLGATLGWLESQGVRVKVIGPVPFYDKNVPATLALGAAHGKTRLDRSAQAQRERHEAFLNALGPWSERPSIDHLDPMDWLCNGTCRVQDGGRAMYRDHHHLSEAGALALREPLARALAPRQEGEAR